MVAKRLIPPTQASADDYTWQLIIEFDLAGEPASDRLIADRVTAALEPLGWPDADLQRRKQAVVDATRNVLERSYLSGSKVQVTIRVLIRATKEKTQRANRPGGVSGRQQAAGPAELTPFRGQGFFLVQKQVVSSQIPTGDAHYVIELFVY